MTGHWKATGQILRKSRSSLPHKLTRGSSRSGWPPKRANREIHPRTAEHKENRFSGASGLEPPVFNVFSMVSYSETLNNLTGDPNNDYGVGPGGPGTGFCSPAGGFSDNGRSGKPLRLPRLKNRPRDDKNQHQDHQDHPCTHYQPPLYDY